jgi:glycine amidinotransferase
VIVNCHNEWDPLEEVIVGTVDGAMVPAWHVAIEATMPEDQFQFFRASGGKPFPAEWIDEARQELEQLVGILEREGIRVRRPDPFDFGRPFSTPDWSSPAGLYSAMPRDPFLVVGDEIIEAPMAWRSRYFEAFPFRRLFAEYFAAGARWTAAPRPRLPDELYERPAPTADGAFRSAIGEQEPTFDAADFVRCGRDIFGQRSHVTNRFGIEWLRRHLGDRYRVHELSFHDPHPMHIDGTLLPLAPGKLLINPERVQTLPAMFESWDVIAAPPPRIPPSHPLFMSSKWVSMNVFMLDERRVIIESREEELGERLARRGFEPIPCDFQFFNSFGGSFHCATLDVRRRGELYSYF